MLPYTTFGHRFFLSEVKWLPVWLAWTTTAPQLILSASSLVLLSRLISSPPLNVLISSSPAAAAVLALISAAPFLTCSAHKLAHPLHLLPPCLHSAASGENCMTVQTSSIRNFFFFLFCTACSSHAGSQPIHCIVLGCGFVFF